jgi:hypothetical protein
VLGVEGVVRSVEKVVLIAVGDVLVGVAVAVDEPVQRVVLTNVGHDEQSLASQSAFSWLTKKLFDWAHLHRPTLSWMYEPLMTTHWRSDVVLGEELVVRSVEGAVLLAVGDVLVGVAVDEPAQRVVLANEGHVEHSRASQSAFS